MNYFPKVSKYTTIRIEILSLGIKFLTCFEVPLTAFPSCYGMITITTALNNLRKENRIKKEGFMTCVGRSTDCPSSVLLPSSAHQVTISVLC
jgi:hypothetical protein